MKHKFYTSHRATEKSSKFTGTPSSPVHKKGVVRGVEKILSRSRLLPFQCLLKVILRAAYIREGLNKYQIIIRWINRSIFYVLIHFQKIRSFPEDKMSSFEFSSRMKISPQFLYFYRNLDAYLIALKVLVNKLLTKFAQKVTTGRSYFVAILITGPKHFI